MAELNLKHLSTLQKKSSKYIEDTLAKKLKQRTAQNKPTNAFISDNIFGR